MGEITSVLLGSFIKVLIEKSLDGLSNIYLEWRWKTHST